MVVIDEPLRGLRLLQPKIFRDGRGQFVKTFHSRQLTALDLPFTPAEEFFSISHLGVLRGMHFQLPPHHHTKIVYCAQGKVLDVVLDLRTKSPSYGCSVARELNSENRLMFYIPPGFAHGFLTLQEDSMMVYMTSTGHEPESDSGVRWDSFPCEWGCLTPNISARDAAFPALSEFNSPFS